MPKVYRSMKPAPDGFPVAEPTARGLGVREPGPHSDVDVDPSGLIVLNGRGMSVARSWRELPPHRIPRRMDEEEIGAKGNDEDRVWCLGQGDFQAGPVTAALLLAIKTHKPSGGNLVPAGLVKISQFQADLAATRKEWTVDET